VTVDGINSASWTHHAEGYGHHRCLCIWFPPSPPNQCWRVGAQADMSEELANISSFQKPLSNPPPPCPTLLGGRGGFAEEGGSLFGCAGELAKFIPSTVPLKTLLPCQKASHVTLLPSRGCLHTPLLKDTSASLKAMLPFRSLAQIQQTPALSWL
jgi:hypothetical protein